MRSTAVLFADEGARRDWLLGQEPLEANVFLAVLFLILIVGMTLPRGQRKRVGGPLVLVALALAFALSRSLFSGAAADGAHAAGLFCLLAGLLRATVLLIFDAVLGRIGYSGSKIMRDLVQWVLLLVILGVVLEQAGVTPTALFAGSAFITVALGFAVRDTFGNLIAGLTLQAQPPFKVGDWIQFDPNSYHIGRVIEINWRATKVMTLDATEVILPNGQLAQAYIRNFTQPDPWSRRSIYVVAPYHVPPNRVRQIILNAIADGFGVLGQPPPSVVTNAFTDRGIEYWVRFFTTEFDKRDRVDGDVRDRIWYAFARHGITIPVATHAVQVTSLPPPEAVAEAEALAQRLELFRRVDLFSALPENAVQALAAGARRELYAEGSPVVRQGEPGGAMYLVESGRVVILAQQGSDQPVEVAQLGSGDFFGEMSLMTGAPRTATVRAAQECRVLALDPTVVGNILRADPALASRICEVLARREAELGNRLASAVPKPAPADLLNRVLTFFGLNPWTNQP